jgi:NAD(P)-dependent dehydrogenase (short-subunit alcohol dehydrogenase family)
MKRCWFGKASAVAVVIVENPGIGRASAKMPAARGAYVVIAARGNRL